MSNYLQAKVEIAFSLSLISLRELVNCTSFFVSCSLNELLVFCKQKANCHVFLLNSFLSGGVKLDPTLAKWLKNGAQMFYHHDCASALLCVVTECYQPGKLSDLLARCRPRWNWIHRPFFPRLLYLNLVFTWNSHFSLSSWNRVPISSFIS